MHMKTQTGHGQSRSCNRNQVLLMLVEEGLAIVICISEGKFNNMLISTKIVTHRQMSAVIYIALVATLDSISSYLTF